MSKIVGDIEVWAPVVGYEGMYEVSNFGRVKSLINRWGIRKKPKILSPRYDGKGYVQMRLYRDGVSQYLKLHRMVMEAFVPNPHNLPQVNHIDEVKTNNMVDNLEWCTGQKNMEHTFAKTYIFKSPEGLVVEIYNLRQFCLDNKLTQANMHKVLNQERSHHKGWRAMQ